MHWTTLYEQKKCTAAQAVKKIRSGDRVVIGHAVSEPTRLVEAMVEDASRLRDVEVVHMIAMGASPYCKPETVC